MSEMQHLITPALIFSGVALVSLVCQLGAWRLRLPAILFLLLAGILLGRSQGYCRQMTSLVSCCFRWCRCVSP